MKIPYQLKKYCFKKGQKPWNYNPIIKICPECRKEFKIPKCHKNRRKYCSKNCLAKAQSRERKGKFGIEKTNPMYKNGISLYRRWAYEKYPKQCSICGINENLNIHHKDENRKNNKIENLQIVCVSCHKFIIHKLKRNKEGKFTS